jgi:hypothetical protein
MKNYSVNIRISVLEVKGHNYIWTINFGWTAATFSEIFFCHFPAKYCLMKKLILNIIPLFWNLGLQLYDYVTTKGFIRIFWTAMDSSLDKLLQLECSKCSSIT